MKENTKLIAGRIFVWLMVGWILFQSIRGMVQCAGFIPGCMTIYPTWMTVLLCAQSLGAFLLITLPLVVGLILRRDWARKLWIVLLIIGLFEPLQNYWFFGPFSPKNSIEYITGFILGKMVLLAICFSRPFRRFMCKEGRKFWKRLALCGAVASIAITITFSTVISYWSSFPDEGEPVQLINIPAINETTPLPPNWSETTIDEWLIPVPTGSTNNQIIADDGVEMNVFMVKEGETVLRMAFLSDAEAIYKCLPEIYGINTLERDFKNRYTLNTLFTSRMFRLARPINCTHAGFRSTEGFDLMCECWTHANNSYARISLDRHHPQKHYELTLQSKESMTIEEWLALISRIRLTTEASAQK